MLELVLVVTVVLIFVGPVIAIMALTEARRQRDRLDKLEEALGSKPPPGATATARPPASARVTVQTPIPEPAIAPRAKPTTPAPRAEVKRPGTTEPPRRASEPPTVGNTISELLFGGNTAARVGVVLLFFGVGFLLKYAAEHGMLPIEARLAATAIGAIAMLLIGWRLRASRPGYALAMQGGGIGIFYLTVFAALRLYQLIPTASAFAVLVATSALAALLAVRQNARTLALLAVVGGFLAPILASTGVGNHVTLFGYYSVLNAGILGIAWFRAWRILNLVGFVFTFVLGGLWGYRYYQPQFFSTTEPFLVLFFLFYVAIAILFATRQAPALKGYIDGTLVFGTPVVAFALQAALVRSHAYGLAWSAFAVGTFYLTLVRVLFRTGPATLRMLNEAFLALGVAFITLAVPMAFDGRWTAAAWALEGAAIIWVGVRQHRMLARAAGVVLQLGAGVAFLIDAAWATGAWPVLNGYYLGRVLLSAAALFSAYQLYRSADAGAWERLASHLLLSVGLLWWFGAGLYELQHNLADDDALSAALLFIALSCALAHMLGRRLDWRALSYPAFGLMPVMFGAALAGAYIVAHPFAGIGYLSWPASFALYYWLLRRLENQLGEPYVRYGHASAVWLLAIIGAWEFQWAVDRLVQGAGTWPLIAWALVPALVLMGVVIGASRLAWPLARHRETYLGAGTMPLVVFLLGWSVFANLYSRGDPWPLPYVALLNPLDLAQGFALVAVLIWFWRARGLLAELGGGQTFTVYWAALAATVFLWANAVLVRSLHHWAGVDFSWHAIFSSVLVQSALAIFWALLGLGTMLVATRMRTRLVWFSGAGLLAVVVAKLFLIDLANTGTIARVVSFIGVGVLFLVVGYLSPVPPRAQVRETP